MTPQWNTSPRRVLGSLASRQTKTNLDKARQNRGPALTLNGRNAGCTSLAPRIAMEQRPLDQAEKELRLAQFADPNNAEATICAVWSISGGKAGDLSRSVSKRCLEAPTEMLPCGVCRDARRAQSTDEALDCLNGKLLSFEHSAVLRDAVGQLSSAKRICPAVATAAPGGILPPMTTPSKSILRWRSTSTKQYRESATCVAKLVSTEKYKRASICIWPLGECYDRPQVGRRPSRRSSRLAGQPGTPEAWPASRKVSLERNDIRRAEMSLRQAASLGPRVCRAADPARLTSGSVRIA